MNTSDDQSRELCLALVQGPALLFLGQETLRKGTGTDLLLRTASAKLGVPQVQNYRDLLNAWPGREQEHLFATLHHISEHILVTDWLLTVAEILWNTVFTTCIDEVIDRAFRNDWREIDPLFNDRRIPENPRSRHYLHLHKLYGCVTRNQPEELPPTTSLGLLQRRAVAERMLADLATLVTPEGVLVIDGLAATDWLPLASMLAQIALLGDSQAHWFSAPPELHKQAEIKELVQESKLVLHEGSLGEFIAWGKGQSLLLMEGALPDAGGDIALTLGSGERKRRLTFDRTHWRQMTRGLPVLEDSVVKSPGPFTSPDDQYATFRRFLAGKQGMPNWEDYARRLPFRRTGFEGLLTAVRDGLTAARYHSEPLLVSGQSGVGKTVALADLAYQMRLEGWPVVYLGRAHTRTRVDFRKLDEVCQELEDLLNQAALIIWDGLQELEEYADLATYLSGRGRKTMLVGSTYGLGARLDRRHRTFEFKAVMTPQEQEEFRAHLEGIEPKIVEYTSPENLGHKNFLALLYLLLPETRANLRSGLLREYAYKEQRLQMLDDQRAAQVPSVDLGWFASLVREANPGFYDKLADHTGVLGVVDAAGAPATRMYRLSGLILVPGRFGMDVPIDLVLRCLGAEGFEILRTALRNEDIYRWIDDDQGNYMVGARQSLEARLICDSRFTPENELDFIRTLLTGVRLPVDWQRPNVEVDFIYRLLRLIGPDGEYHGRFARIIERVFEGMEELRERSAHRSHPRLLELEGHLRREFVRVMVESGDPTVTNRETAMRNLNKAKESLLKAEEIVLSAPNAERRYANLLSRVHTELAGLLGSSQVLNRRFLAAETDPARINEFRAELATAFQESMEHSRQAISYRGDNTHPVDVRAWVIRNRLEEDPDIPPEVRLCLIGEYSEILEDEIWESQPIRRQEHRLSLANLLNDNSLREDAIASLQSLGSMAGHYIIARQIAYKPSGEFSDTKALLEALAYMDGLGPAALSDLRLLRLYLRLWWHVFGNPELFQRERVTASLSPEGWERYRDLLSKRLSFSEEGSNLHTRFCYAWALFQCRQFRQARDEFRILDQQTLYGRYRVQKLATWCDGNGIPISCTGTVRFVSNDYDRGEVYCPQTRMDITFKPREFAENLRRDDPLDDDGFYITLNFRGTSADPRRFYKPARHRP